MKGIIINKIGHKPYTHKLEELTNEIQKLNINVPEKIFDSAIELEEHYIQTRYPDARLNEYSEKEAKKAIEQMEMILNYFRNLPI